MSEAVAERPKTRPTHSSDPEKVARGLLALAECNGNQGKAAALLAEDGFKIDPTTLCRWKLYQHREQYERVREEVLPKVMKQAAERHMDLSERLMDTEVKILKRLDSEVDKLDPRDLAGSLRNVSTSGAIHVDKATGPLSEGTSETRRLDAGEVMRKLASRGTRVEATERTVVVERSEGDG